MAERESTEMNHTVYNRNGLDVHMKDFVSIYIYSMVWVGGNKMCLCAAESFNVSKLSYYNGFKSISKILNGSTF